MVRSLFDTSILIDHLSGRPLAEQVIHAAHRPMISLITYMEVLVGAGDAKEADTLRHWMGQQFEVVPVSLDIAHEAVLLRQQRRIKLPDAIIWASARLAGAVLVTRNTKDFPEIELDVRVPYHL
jgi:predicted nucleic acid-binding protein